MHTARAACIIKYVVARLQIYGTVHMSFVDVGHSFNAPEMVSVLCDCSVVGRDPSITVFGPSDASSSGQQSTARVRARSVSEHSPCQSTVRVRAQPVSEHGLYQSTVRVRARSVSEHGPCQIGWAGPVAAGTRM